MSDWVILVVVFVVDFAILVAIGDLWVFAIGLLAMTVGTSIGLARSRSVRHSYQFIPQEMPKKTKKLFGLPRAA